MKLYIILILMQNYFFKVIVYRKNMQLRINFPGSLPCPSSIAISKVCSYAVNFPNSKKLHRHGSTPFSSFPASLPSSPSLTPSPLHLPQASWFSFISLILPPSGPHPSTCLPAPGLLPYPSPIWTGPPSPKRKTLIKLHAHHKNT